MSKDIMLKTLEYHKDYVGMVYQNFYIICHKDEIELYKSIGYKEV